MVNTNYLIKSKINKGYSSTELAKILDVNASTITRWEQGTMNPKTELVIKLCQILGMDSNILLGLKK